MRRRPRDNNGVDVADGRWRRPPLGVDRGGAEGDDRLLRAAAGMARVHHRGCSPCCGVEILGRSRHMGPTSRPPAERPRHGRRAGDMLASGALGIGASGSNPVEEDAIRACPAAPARRGFLWPPTRLAWRRARRGPSGVDRSTAEEGRPTSSGWGQWVRRVLPARGHCLPEQVRLAVGRPTQTCGAPGVTPADLSAAAPLERGQRAPGGRCRAALSALLSRPEDAAGLTRRDPRRGYAGVGRWRDDTTTCRWRR